MSKTELNRFEAIEELSFIKHDAVREAIEESIRQTKSAKQLDEFFSRLSKNKIDLAKKNIGYKDRALEYADEAHSYRTSIKMSSICLFLFGSLGALLGYYKTSLIAYLPPTTRWGSALWFSTLAIACFNIYDCLGMAGVVRGISKWVKRHEEMPTEATEEVEQEPSQSTNPTDQNDPTKNK